VAGQTEPRMSVAKRRGVLWPGIHFPLRRLCLAIRPRITHTTFPANASTEKEGVEVEFILSVVLPKLKKVPSLHAHCSL
jgi:hypothetical protein